MTSRARPDAAVAPVEGMLARVRAAGLRITPQRLAIIEALADDASHPTAQQLFDRLRPSLPTMSFATVYNTLSMLSDAGLCVARSLSRGPARFDPNTAPHDHAVCDGCGVVYDVAHDGEVAFTAIGGFEVRLVERIYRGRCGGCRLAAAVSHQAAAAGGGDPTTDSTARVTRAATSDHCGPQGEK